MAQVKEQKELTMFERMMLELKEQEQLITYKIIALGYINNAIENLNIQNQALELLKGSMISIHTAKNKQELEFYLKHAEDFIRNIENNKQ